MASTQHQDDPQPRRAPPKRGHSSQKTHIDVLLKACRTDDPWPVRLLFALVASLRISMPVTVLGSGSLYWIGRHFIG